jgi:glycosyltransferase involved in cell wall biosynthesis
MLSFSIITCTWNSEPYIAQCMQSVEAQDYGAVEQVFVDGGSNDGTLERIRATSFPGRWVTDVRGGISNAMNEGVRLAQGDLVAHLHGDDYYLDTKVLSTVAEVMERTNARWLFGRIASDLGGHIVRPTWKMPTYSRTKLISRNFVAHPATFMRRDLFLELGGFDTTLRYAMDYDFWLRASKLANPVYLDHYLTAFRRHEGSASTANALPAFEEDHAVRRRYLAGQGALIRHDLVHYWRRIRHFGKWSA